MSDHLASTDTAVASSLRALLSGIVDYAGLFPPAGLPLDDAIRNYARYRTGDDAWMLARFVIPTRRLSELRAYGDLFHDEPPFRFSVLGTGGDDAAAFVGAFRADLSSLRAFHDDHPARVRADVMEVCLPADVLRSEQAALQRFLDDVQEALSSSAVPALDLFLEVPVDEHLATRAPGLLRALAAFNATYPNTFGLKMRTGGLDPSAFPDAVPVADTIVRCRDAGVRFKATAGLHHPLCRFDDGVRARMFGFFNVFGAAVLAAEHALDAAAVRRILVDEDAAHWRFTEDTMHWNDLSVPTASIRRHREQFAISFGSCSFDEPRDDLRTLGLF